MRLALSALVLVTCNALAQEPPIRFAVGEAWSMPLMDVKDGEPYQGIMYDLLRSLAIQVGSPAQYQVLPRLRMAVAMERGDVDVRCYTAQSWQPNLSGDYIWSLPLIEQRDFLVARAGDAAAVNPDELQGEYIGTVLGYAYDTLEQGFRGGRLIRDDARSQGLVLEKLAIGRYRYAVTNQLSLAWFNRHRPATEQLQPVALLQVQQLGCYVRNDPALPVQRILRVLLRMKMSGEIERIQKRYDSLEATP